MTRRFSLGLVGPLPPPNGGMAMQTEQLARLMREEGLAVEIVQTNAPYRPHWVERIRIVRAGFRLLPYLVQVWRLAGRSDVIHLMANSGALDTTGTPCACQFRRSGRALGVSSGGVS
jgi:hypothetical protein